MPIYEYRCTECEAQIEKMQKVSDAPLETCEKCGGKLEKQWSLSGFQFKGAGWYVTDYSNKGKPDTKSETKSTTKSEAPANGGGSGSTAAAPTTTAAEKSSGGESTAAPSGASNSAKSDSSGSKKE